MESKSQRIQKILAKNGYGSRRGIESLIEQQRITVNSSLATQGMQVSSEDVICIDNNVVELG